MDAKRQKLYFPEKVCFVCKVILDSFDYLFFIRDLSKGDVEFCDALLPLVRLKSAESLSICGIDSTVFMVEDVLRNVKCHIPQPVYYLDLDPNKYKSLNLNLNSGDLRKLPPMSADKDHPVITRVPTSKRLLVFSTLLTYSRTRDDDNDNDTVDPSTRARIDFEMYDLDTQSWVILPRFCLRIARARTDRARVELFDPIARCWNRVRGSARGHELAGYYRITHYTFIDDTTLVVQLDIGFMLKLDLASMGRGWKVYKEDCCCDRVFVISEAYGGTWCASDVKVDMDMDTEECLELPLSSFDVPTEMSGFLRVNRLERKRKRKECEYVCALQTALRKRNGYLQMVIDVFDIDVGGDGEVKRVASFRSELRWRCLRAYPSYIFQYQLPAAQDSTPLVAI